MGAYLSLFNSCSGFMIIMFQSPSGTGVPCLEVTSQIFILKLFSYLRSKVCFDWFM